MDKKDKKYVGACLHGCYRQDPNIPADYGTINLKDVPEEVVDQQVCPIIEQLEEILSQYNSHVWITKGLVSK